jgi:hypothetical protein
MKIRKRLRTTRESSRTLVLVTAAILAGSVMLTPATAHVTEDFLHLWSDHIRPRLSTPGTLNSATNPVDWTKLKNVPSNVASMCHRGAVLGAVTVPVYRSNTADFPTQYSSTVPGILPARSLFRHWFNACSTNPSAVGNVLVRRADTGIYYVRFVSNPATIGVATSAGRNNGWPNLSTLPNENQDNVMDVIHAVDPLDGRLSFKVTVWDNDDSSKEDMPFTLVAF